MSRSPQIFVTPEEHEPRLNVTDLIDTYPESVGLNKKLMINVLGKHKGRNLGLQNIE